MAQKKSACAAEQVKGLRQALLEVLSNEDVTRFKFVDETSVNLMYTRRYGLSYGRAARGPGRSAAQRSERQGGGPS